ncbi:MAG: hypothetical protein NT123_16685 [Proteobacteria bacterium]|nr:hypothetical protein [Pseudomonadota bacterium]
MPVFIKLVIAVNAVCLFVLALLGLSAAGGFVSGVFPPNERHEMKLVPIQRKVPERSRSVESSVPRAVIPPEYQTIDPTPSPWVAMPDGSVRFVRSE